MATPKQQKLIKHPGGRPTDYSEGVLEKSQDYLCNFEQYGDSIPSIAGLASVLGLSRSTIYDWTRQSDKQKFSDIIENILSAQEKVLINKGLTGEYNSTITKVILGKHGYSDKQELTGKDGEKLEMGVVILPQKNVLQDSLETSE